MILVDHPQRWPHGPTRIRTWCHMISTLPGDAGTKELIAFGARLGLAPRWLQKRGSCHEHFDISLSRRADALRMGAVATERRAFVEAMRAKREPAETSET